MVQKPRPFESLRNAAQYVRRFRHHPFVVKLGGEILDEPGPAPLRCASSWPCSGASPSPW